MASFDDAPDASKAMLTAALGGLLSFGVTSGCVFSVSEQDDGPEVTSTTNGTSSSATSSSSGMGGAPSTSSATSTSTDAGTTSSVATGSTVSGTATGSTATGATNPHTPIPDTACVDGIVPNPVVTLSTVVGITQSQFEAMCAEANGIFEIQPLCGGSNACRGFTYDTGSMTYTEHTCQHTNTCAGYNCVVCDDEA